LQLSDVTNFVFHPGGTKVLEAYEEVIAAPSGFLDTTRAIINRHGNMSSATVLYVLAQAMKQGLNPGYSLMVAMGPGFSSEMALLHSV